MKNTFCYFVLLTLTFSSFSLVHSGTLATVQANESAPVGQITLSVENLQRGSTFNEKRALEKLRTKVGDPFSQLTFDHDLKALSQEYDRVEPTLETRDGKVFITIKLWQKPMIRQILWEGNKQFKTSTLQKELGIRPDTIFNREEFNQAFNKVKEYYIKKGYFESELDYKIIPFAQNNEVDIQINIHEGSSGHILWIDFTGLSKEEESAILGMLVTKKYNFFTSWLTGHGTYQQEALDHDKLVIVNYLQNRGYADARVNIDIQESPSGRLIININADKGERFSFGTISINGNELYSQQQVEQALLIHKGAPFSPERLRDSIEQIKDLYGKDGYIETNIHYTLNLEHEQPIYNVAIQIEEGIQFRIGLIRVLGNVSTNKNVILRESLLVPGEVFDSRRLKATQSRLEAMGYFKSVNVYAVKTPEDHQLGDHYRDVVIEVEETTTGSMSLFFGFSSVDDVFGGLDFSENNFDHRGLFSWWRDGLSSLRGGGEYLHARAQIGKKQQSYTLAWMDPYFRDTLWRVGFDVNYSLNRLQSDSYHIKTIGGSVFANYPLTNYWSFGMKTRIRNSILKINGIENDEAQRERQNAGLVFGFGPSLTFDSTDNAFKPRRGFRSVIDAEIAGVRRRSSDPRMFPFARFGYVNTYYYPVWRKGTLKVRWDLKFLYPFGLGSPDDMPLSERFFLGGETTVRGYKPYNIGPKFRNKKGEVDKDDPTGGISSSLASVEYMQNIFPMLDLFVFFDGGSVSLKRFDIPNFRMSYGFGTRIELANRVPLLFGYGIPINRGPNEKKNFFFSMGGQF